MNKNLIRIIPKLDIKNGLLIKGINLEGLRVLGNPYEFAEFYYKSGADEICYIDNVATLYGTNNLQKFVTLTSKNIFVPLSVGGGIKTIKDIELMLNSGADKVSINSAAIDDINFIYDAAKKFGSSTIVTNIETVKINNKYYISKSNGRDIVNINPVSWAKKIQDYGSGEIFITCVNNEGLQSGFDINIISKICKNVNIPIIAHGGAGKFEHVLKVINETNISGVSLSSLLHYGIFNKFNFKSKNVGNINFLENNRDAKIKDNFKRVEKLLI
jgi:Imidazoleglycerol-phosphate synthase